MALPWSRLRYPYVTLPLRNVAVRSSLMLLVDARIRSDEGLIEELPMYVILNLKLRCCSFRGLSRLGILRILTPSLFGFVLSPLCSRLEEDTYFREMKLGADLARYLSLR